MSDTNSIAIFTRASQMLAEADTIQKTKELKNLALTAADWARRKGMGAEAVRYAQSYAFEAERKMGEMLAATERAKGAKGNPGGRGAPVVRSHAVTTQPTLNDLGITKRESSDAQLLAKLPEKTFVSVKSGEKKLAEVKRELRRETVVAKLEDVATRTVKEVAGVYDVVVVDPPWPMEKIERDVRPNQVAFDYPTMDEAAIAGMDIHAADDCHVWLWTTHKFLPMAFRILDAWKLRYVCTFVWHKTGGFQPIGLPQYNCEFALYARKGSPQFVDTKAFNVCFDAPRGAHSEKPDIFYETLCRVTAGRRLDMFGRRDIDGFDSWGLEAPDAV